MAVVVTFAIVLLVVFLALGSYNRLLALRRKVLQGWRQVELQLRRRHDVVRKLLTSVRGTASVDGAALDAVMAARDRAAAARGPADIARKEKELSQALAGLYLLIQSDAQLATNQQVHSLREELTATEHAITSARQIYNALAITYNAAIRVVPINVIASVGNFRAAEPSSEH